MMHSAALRISVLTALAMMAFAGNSLLCRLALKHTAIDAATFTGIRMAAAAAVLWLIVAGRRPAVAGAGNWLSALALFAYAALFSFAYIALSAATGALLLFGSVQLTMIGYGLWSGERFRASQVFGLTLALAGLAGLLLPGLSAPPVSSAILMIGAGVAWGVYSLRGRGAGDPTTVTAGNFLRTVPMALALSAVMAGGMAVDTSGIVYAILSGALTSGIGYAIWYTALPSLKASHAATVQLSVPVIAALGGVVLIGEPLTLRLTICSIAVLSGIALVIVERTRT